jgi:hypothetical protein
MKAKKHPKLPAPRFTKRVKLRMPKAMAVLVRKGISKAEFIRKAIAHNLPGLKTQLAAKGGAR